MAAQHGRSLHGKIILLNLLPIQLFKERDLHFQPDQSEKRKMGVKTQNKKTGKVYREKERGSVEEKKKKTGRREAERKDGYKENMLRRKGACQAATVAVAAELTEHRISDAVKLENTSQQSSLGRHSGRNCLVRVRD